MAVREVSVAERFVYAPVTPFAVVRMSGWTPQWSTPNHRPVRPQPVMTSSAIRRTSWAFVIARIRGRYSGTGTMTPFVPTTGSTIIAATSPSCSSW
jgi:hypothetical protein